MINKYKGKKQLIFKRVCFQQIKFGYKFNTLLTQLQMNKVIDDYTLLQKIGSGQYGNVYKAEHKTHRGLFAVKVMNVEKFKQTPKLTILGKINHPNIIRFVQMLRTNNNYYLIYEYCNEGTLAQMIKRKGRLSETEAIKILGQIRSAFEVLHKSRILHRDIKPTNILFHNGCMKLADFGFCKQLMKEHDMTQTMVGSPIYMAPEVLKGLIYDSRADLWSIGVILYEMLYGVCPYEEGTIQKLINLIDNNFLKFPQQIKISQKMKVLIKRLLVIKYRERITPQQFIEYPIFTIVNVQNNEKQKTNIAINANVKDAGKFIRKSIFYLGQTLQIVTAYIEDLNYLRLCFFIYKILLVLQKYTMKGSAYWTNLGIQNNIAYWDIASQEEVDLIIPYGEKVRQVLAIEDIGLKTKLELETEFVDAKYLLQTMKYTDEDLLKVRLLNCFLFYRHFLMIMDKKIIDFVDPTTDRLTLRQKDEICFKFARYN